MIKDSRRTCPLAACFAIRSACLALSVAATLSAILVSSTAHAQERGFVTVWGPKPLTGEPVVRIDVGGRPIPAAGYGHAQQFPAGKHVLHAEAIDERGRVVLTRDQVVFIHPNRITDVYVPAAETLPNDTALVGGGIAVTTFGVLAVIGSGLLLTMADGAGTQCFDADHWAADLCGYEPGPLVGWGVTTLLFGLAGVIGGPVMIAEGAALEPEWVVPDFKVGLGSAALEWTF